MNEYDKNVRTPFGVLSFTFVFGQKEKILEIYPTRVYTASVKVQLSTFINAYEKGKR